MEHVDESKIRYYDEFNVGYGTEEEKEKLIKELEDELKDFMTEEEIKIICEDETKDLIANKDIKVQLLENYQRYANSDFKRGAIGVVRNWRFFRYSAATWYYAYVMVEINGESYPVNINKLKVLDDNFIEAERRYFRNKYLTTYKYIPSDNLLILDKDTQIHCTALVDRILNYLED